MVEDDNMSTFSDVRENNASGSGPRLRRVVLDDEDSSDEDADADDEAAGSEDEGEEGEEGEEGDGGEYGDSEAEEEGGEERVNEELLEFRRGTEMQ